ncbi:5-deoxy-glucuronate isomerase [Microbacterium protaetiae]|uniref:5-deoxy-glucuronate isomerase n=1 Tax=Microbacterium protaetiae TaxID=2509458 RepID=A0A4P6EDP2_9MICO|nr:5-deoxy-glucuronate isomerase [Microbacterium protaetiae]QAY59189.1 5-deoxy-glucuronate isomerase [Microbacterium protaetiae]
MNGFLRAGAGDTVVEVTPDGAQWRHTGLTVRRIGAGETMPVSTAGRETLIVPLAGGAEVDIGGRPHTLRGRASVWEQTDVLYVPEGADAALTCTAPARMAFCWAPTQARHPAQHLTPDDVPVELRGAGVCSREVRNLGTPAHLQADRLIVCEVLTPGGDWSSYPPHKHDTAGPDESELEEIYHYEIAASPAGTPGFALQRVYASDEREIDIAREVRDGDTVLIPFGYHGPTVAAPGHDLYYLNVMAGPGHGADRRWLITDDPAHAWVRQTWPQLEVDPRLPFRR